MGSGMCKSPPASADIIHQDSPMEDDAQHQNRRAKGYRDGERDAGSQALLQQAHYRAAGTEDGEDRFTDPLEHEQMNAVHSTSMKSPQREVANAPPPSGSLAANVRKPVIHRRKKKRATVAPAILDPFENFPALSGGENNMYQANQARYHGGQRIQNKKDTIGSDSSSSSNYSRDRVGESSHSAAISQAGADQEEKRHAKIAEEELRRIESMKKLPCPTVDVGPATAAVEEAINADRFDTGIEGLRQRWGEVEFLLRIPIESEDDFSLVHRTAFQSIILLNDIESISQEVGILQGALSRALMPYGVNTHAADQSWYSRPQDDEAGMSPEILERVGESRCGTLRSRLTDLRKLVRVKIADDGDLKQARRAVTDIDAFCRLVKDIAGQKQMAAHDMLATLR